MTLRYKITIIDNKTNTQSTAKFESLDDKTLKSFIKQAITVIDTTN